MFNCTNFIITNVFFVLFSLCPNAMECDLGGNSEWSIIVTEEIDLDEWNLNPNGVESRLKRPRFGPAHEPDVRVSPFLKPRTLVQSSCIDDERVSFVLEVSRPEGWEIDLKKSNLKELQEPGRMDCSNQIYRERSQRLKTLQEPGRIDYSFQIYRERIQQYYASDAEKAVKTLNNLNKRTIFLGREAQYQQVSIVFPILLDSIDDLIKNTKKARERNSTNYFHIWSPEGNFEKEITSKVEITALMLSLCLEKYGQDQLLWLAKLYFESINLDRLVSRRIVQVLEYFADLVTRQQDDNNFVPGLIDYLIIDKNDYIKDSYLPKSSSQAQVGVVPSPINMSKDLLQRIANLRFSYR